MRTSGTPSGVSPPPTPDGAWMSQFRLAWRAAALVSACAAAYAAVLVWNVAAWVFRFSPTRGRLRLFRLWSRAILRVLGATVSVLGAAPKPPFLLVSNHLSYVDIAVIASQAEAVFVARGDLAEWPIFGVLSRSVGTLYVDREMKRDIPRAAAAMERRLQDGVGVVLFPEGTSSDGNGVLPFRPSLLDPAARLGIPVHWAVLGYRTRAGQRPASESVCWWSDRKFVPHLLDLLRVSGFQALVVFGDAPLSGSDRKSLAQRLEAEVRRAKEAASW